MIMSVEEFVRDNRGWLYRYEIANLRSYESAVEKMNSIVKERKRFIKFLEKIGAEFYFLKK